jgi:Methyltransferase domain
MAARLPEREGTSFMPELPALSRTVPQLEALARMNDAKTYLEIGVAKGNTFMNATFFELRHGVDPRPRFDTAVHGSDSVCFFEMTSDDFFVNHADPKQKYDIVFLDGLHTFEQTFRDLCCSQAHSHDDTIWLIDDVHPTDIFSAHPDQRLAYRYRERHGIPGKAWHGDVFKVVFAINDFFPNLSYRTVVGNGNPQAVVIRRQRHEFAPVFGDFEQISRMTYYDFAENRHRMNFASDDDVITWLSG